MFIATAAKISDSTASPGGDVVGKKKDATLNNHTAFHD